MKGSDIVRFSARSPRRAAKPFMSNVDRLARDNGYDRAEDRRRGAYRRTAWRRATLILVTAILLAWALPPSSSADDEQELAVGYLREPQSKISLSLMDIPAQNNGVAGALLAIDDDNTTGGFTNQHFTLIQVPVTPDGENVNEALDGLVRQGVTFVITNLSAPILLKAAAAARVRGVTLLNVGATDDRLREEDCRANVIHVAPSRGMLADGLAQYLVWKKWSRWLLVSGSHDSDKLFADALRRAARRFGAKIVAEREFVDSGGARRTDSGVAEIQRQMPTTTQGAPDYDVLVAADENDVFAGYLPYRTWDPRPVAGSAGLVPTSWNAAFDQWGAVQLQSRFVKMFHRAMTALDMDSWTGARMIGEAAVRTNSTNPNVLGAYLRGPDFSLAAFKGQALTLRSWNLQLRQPILLFDGRNTVSVSPQEGFLHPVTTLDTLGADRPETKCKLQ
jgi:ABC transporter substrate binding protein (PQQ-dependent alcohol dehydrogenase system)